MMKRIFACTFILLAIWGTARFCHYQTKGFRLSKIEGNTTCLEQTSPPMTEELIERLGQKYRFFGRGLQSFSFLSEDGSTVLKLFNNRYQRRLFWLGFTPFQEKIVYNQKKWEMAFTSYQIAYENLREETGLFYFHPEKSMDCPNVILVDPLGIQHEIDLGKYAFVLQKKVTMAYPYFAACAAKEDFKGAEKGFLSLFSLLKSKMQQGIADKDPLIRTNFGFFEDKAIQIDIGPLSYDPTLKDPKKQKEELEKISIPLRHFLENHHPKLLPQFYDAFQSL